MQVFGTRKCMQHWCAGVAVFATQDADLTGVVIGISNLAAYGRGDPSVGVKI